VVVIKNRSTTESLEVRLNNTLALPFIRILTRGCLPGEILEPLEACLDDLVAERGTMVGRKGTLRITMKKVRLGGEETKNISLEAR
jgi:hypothetical protein